MSIIKCELNINHLALLRHFKCNLKNGDIILSIESDGEIPVVLTDVNKYEHINLVLNGVPDDFDPFNTEDIVEYSDEQKTEWDKLYNELPLALSIILQRGSFETGKFKAKYHDQVWVKIS